MLANTIKELPVMLLEMKIESMNDDFITNIKQKITAKKQKSARNIFTMGQRPPIKWKGRNTKEIAKQNFKRFPLGTPGNR